MSLLCARPRPCRQLLLALCCVVGLVAPAAVAQAAEGKLMVVAIPNHAAPDFVGVVVSQIIHPLGEQVSMVTGAKAHEAVVQSGLDRAQLRLPRNAQKVGKLAGASHVLVVEATGRGGRSLAQASLVEVRSGKVIHSQRAPMADGHLDAAAAARLAAPIAGKLGGAHRLAAAGGPAPKPPSAGAEAPADGADAWSGGEEATAPEPMAQAAPKRKKGKKAPSAEQEGEAEEAAAEDEEGGKAGADGEAGEEADGGGAAAAAAPRWRPPVRVQVGLEMLQRKGTLPGDLPAGVDAAPSYQGNKTNANPFFMVGRLNLELFPLAFSGKGEAVEGLGLSADLLLSSISNTLIQTGKANTTFRSTLIGSKLAAAYRWVLWEARNAPDLTFFAGLETFAFPLGLGQFPSVSYVSPLLGARIVVPLRQELLAAVASINVDPKVNAGSAARARLSASGEQAGGHAVEIGGGLRGSYKRLAGSLLLRWQQYSTTFRGKTALDGIADQYQMTDAKLQDRFIGVRMEVGLTF